MEMERSEKKRLGWTRVVTIAVLFILALMLILTVSVVRLVSEAGTYLTEVGSIVARLDSMTSQLESLNVESLAAVVNTLTDQLGGMDLTAIADRLDTMTAQLEAIDWEELAGNINGMALTAQEGLTSALNTLSALDIDALNSAIADLKAVVQPLAAFAARFE